VFWVSWKSYRQRLPLSWQAHPTTISALELRLPVLRSDSPIRNPLHLGDNNTTAQSCWGHPANRSPATWATTAPRAEAIRPLPPPHLSITLITWFINGYTFHHRCDRSPPHSWSPVFSHNAPVGIFHYLPYSSLAQSSKSSVTNNLRLGDK
jgi:hypothetical protein